MNSTGTLFARVTKVMQTVKALEPDKKHQQGYMYISSDKALNMIGAAMAQNGLVIVPSVTSQTVDIVEYTNQTGKPMTRFDASVTFAMTLADSDGNDHTAVWVGAGSDFTNPDKAVYKAITSGHKYFMLKLFVVGAGAEDSEHEEAEPGRVQKSGRQTSNPVTTPPANGNPAPGATISDTAWNDLLVSPFTPGAEVMVRGKSDEKPGEVINDEGKSTLQVRVDGKTFWIAREKVTPIPTQPALIDRGAELPLGFDDPATAYAE